MTAPAKRLRVPTCYLTLRQCPTGLRDRLHALAALREARVGARVTLEQIAAEALARGVVALEAELYPARVRRKKSLDNNSSVVVPSTTDEDS